MTTAKAEEGEGRAHQLSLLESLSGPLSVPVSGARPLMAHAFFALDNRANQDRISLQDGDVRIEVIAGRDMGCPTIWDADLLFYVITRALQALDHGVEADMARVQEFPVHDFLRATGRVTTGEAYAAFDQSLERLLGARIKTNIETSSGEADEIVGIDGAFTWFDSETLVGYRKTPGGHRRRTKVRIALGKWLMGHLVNNRSAFRINQEYFALAGGVERRLYNIARVHVGRQDRFEILLPNLMAKVGGSGTLARFGKIVRDLAERNPLPEYTIQVVEPSSVKERRTKTVLNRTRVVFRPRSAAGGRAAHGQTARERGPGTNNVINVDHPALYRRLNALGWSNRLDLAEKARTAYARQHDGQDHAKSRRELADDLPGLCAVLVETGLEHPS